MADHIPTKDHVSNEHEVRIAKLKSLEDLGIAPWPAAEPVNATCTQVEEEFIEGQEKRYTIAGRLMIRREHGKTAFGILQDVSGRVQIYLKADVLGDDYHTFINLIDVGDQLWVQGTPFKTKTGQITLAVEKFVLLSKCLHPLPEKFHGLADIETKYRQRYLDLISDPASRLRFKQRSQIIAQMRSYLNEQLFMEVETPMLHPIPGGAAARPFVTHHNALDSELYLRIAPELYLKRLVVGGFERVYEINRNFRNEGISTRHNPEFTMVELYMANKNYHEMMDLVEDMIRSVIRKSCAELSVPFGNMRIDFSVPFQRLSMADVVIQTVGLDPHRLYDDIDGVMKEHGVERPAGAESWGQKLYAIFEAKVEHTLMQPTFITHFPIEVSPLAKRDPDNNEIAARFELFIAGMELSNGFNELNDPFDQAERFAQQARARTAGDVEAHHFDADYILALEYGLPPTAGAGIGIDRLVMIATNTTSIKDVILFPTLKKKQ